MWSANGPNLRYKKSKLVHSIMRHVAETLGLDLEDLYVHVGWPLYRKYGHAFEAFKVIVTDPDSVLDGLTRKIKEVGPDGQEVTKVVPALTAEVKDSLVRNIRQRMTPQPLKIRADVEMKCFQFDGVLHIKEAMKRAEASGNEDCPVKMKLVAPPLYVLTTQTLDKEQGITVLTNAIKACTEVIDSHKGKLVVKEAPRAVSERDDKLLAVSFSSSFIGSKTLGIILMDTQYVVHMFVGSNFHDDDKYVGDIVLELKGCVDRYEMCWFDLDGLYAAVGVHDPCKIYYYDPVDGSKTQILDDNDILSFFEKFASPCLIKFYVLENFVESLIDYGEYVDITESITTKMLCGPPEDADEIDV